MPAIVGVGVPPSQSRPLLGAKVVASSDPPVRRSFAGAARRILQMRPQTIRLWQTILVIACVLPAMLLATALIVRFYQLERQIREADTLTAARALTQAVDRELASAVAGLQALATSPYLASG